VILTKGGLENVDCEAVKAVPEDDTDTLLSNTFVSVIKDFGNVEYPYKRQIFNKEQSAMEKK